MFLSFSLNSDFTVSMSLNVKLVVSNCLLEICEFTMFSTRLAMD